MANHLCPIHYRRLLLCGDQLICCYPGGCDYKISAYTFDPEYKKPPIPISSAKCPIHDLNLFESSSTDTPHSRVEYSCPNENCNYKATITHDEEGIHFTARTEFGILQCPSDMYAPEGMKGVLIYTGVKVRNILFKPERWFDFSLIILCALSFVFLSLINSICFTAGVLLVYLDRLLKRTIWKDEPYEDEEDD